MGSKQATTASFVKSAPPGEVGEEVKLVDEAAADNRSYPMLLPV